MSKLTREERDELPDEAFGLPEKRAYPVDTRERARDAKARASLEYERGLLTAEERARIDAAADRRLAEPD